MKSTIAISSLLFASMLSLADTHHIETDKKVDFSTFKTFAVREGRVSSRNAEINNKLTLKAIEDSIRATLIAGGLKEAADRPNLIVSFSLAEEGQRGVVGRGIRNAQVVSTSEGTLVIDMTSPAASAPVWHGIYTDDEDNAARLAKKLPGDAKKLLSEFPPKR